MTINTNEFIIPETKELLSIQPNTIELLKSMGYVYISLEDNIALRDNRLHDVVLKDVLLTQLQKINSFEYKGDGMMMCSSRGYTENSAKL